MKFIVSVAGWSIATEPEFSAVLQRETAVWDVNLDGDGAEIPCWTFEPKSIQELLHFIAEFGGGGAEITASTGYTIGDDVAVPQITF